MNKLHYFSIDWNNLFVSSTLHDELLLFSSTPGETYVTIKNECAEYGIVLDQYRSLDTYSGGEQAIICCLFLCALLPRKPLRILFVHVLETLSMPNKERIIAHFHRVLPQAVLFSACPEGLERLS